MSVFKLLLTKAFHNFTADMFFLFAARISILERLKYMVRKYVALMTGSRQIIYLNRAFSYDNHWTPTLLQHYPHEISQLLKFIGPTEIITLLDIGANIGQFAATWRFLNSDTRIYSFEPNGTIYSLLKRNAANDRNWMIFPYAIGECEGKRVLFHVPSKSAQGSFYESNATLNLLQNNTTKTDVNVVRLDKETCHRLNLPVQFDFIKIDVEGAEEDVLAGLMNIQWRYLYIECSAERAGVIPEERIWQILTANADKSLRVLYRSGKSAGAMSYDLLIENPIKAFSSTDGFTKS